jgi:hypothetical protein
MEAGLVDKVVATELMQEAIEISRMLGAMISRLARVQVK